MSTLRDLWITASNQQYWWRLEAARLRTLYEKELQQQYANNSVRLEEINNPKESKDDADYSQS